MKKQFIYLKEEFIMNKEERNVQINNFLKKWNEMMDEANKIEDFKWRFDVSITSNDSIIEDRIRTINGINESFTKHGMKWSSTNN